MVYALVLLCALNAKTCDQNNAAAQITARVTRNMCILGIGRFESADKAYSTVIICKDK